MSDRPSLYLTTTIPYVNAAPHLGHALEYVQADAMARWHARKGESVYLLAGTDENAIKNLESAEKAGMDVHAFVDQKSGEFRKLLDALQIRYDQFIRTTEERHMRGAQALWAATDPADIYKKTYTGLYCVGCEQFYEPSELLDGKCPDHPTRTIEEVSEENYFFRLSQYQEFLHEIIASDALRIVPETRKREVLSVIEQGLHDFSISRPASRSKGWGVPVPGDPTQTIYVWYDALANYITALGYPDTTSPLYASWWGTHGRRVHTLGKGVSRFHAIYWPAMLQSAKLPLPTFEFVHGYITVDGAKMSKTTGNVVDPLALVSQYSADPVRWYLLREMPAYDDGDFSLSRFTERYSSDLAHGIGNFASRVSTLASRIPHFSRASIEPRVTEAIEQARVAMDTAMASWKFHEAAGAFNALVSFGDQYINLTKPWEGGEESASAIFNAVVILDNAASLLAPFLPTTAAAITAAIQWTGDDTLVVSKVPPLFPNLP